VRKKSKNQENKKKLKKPNHEKKSIKILKNRPVWFGFISLKPNRTQPKKNEPYRKKTEPNRFESVFVLKNRTETSRFEPVSVFFFKFDLIIFLDKN
jgi:hypothetical protein